MKSGQLTGAKSPGTRQEMQIGLEISIGLKSTDTSQLQVLLRYFLFDRSVFAVYTPRVCVSDLSL